MYEIAFWGAAGHAKVLSEALMGSYIKLVALVDNRLLPSPLLDIPVLAGRTGLEEWLLRRGNTDGLLFAIAIGGAKGTDRLDSFRVMKQLGLLPHTIVHRTAFAASTAELGEGCQLLANSAVCSHARLGTSVIVNTAASIDHDCSVGDGSHIGPGARLAGEIVIGKRVFVGTGAVILPRITVDEDATIGAGAVVTQNVRRGDTVVGNPARPIRHPRTQTAKGR